MKRLLAVLAIVALAAPSVAFGAEDPFRSQQWGLSIIGAPSAWARATGKGVKVAVIDTGVDLAHPDLVDRMGSGKDFVDEGTSPADEHGHGTVVAGIIAATAGNGVGVAGVAPEATILPVRALGADGRGDAEQVAGAIEWSVSAGAQVINLSLVAEGGAISGFGDLFRDRQVEDAISAAARAGVVVVIASGNDPAGGSSETSFQAQDEEVLVVGASTNTDRRAAYSNYGTGLDLLAPGGGSATDAGDGSCTVKNAIVSTWWDRVKKKSGYGASCGTSMATAFVSGVAALLIERGMSAREAAAKIRSSAQDLPPAGPDAQSGRGRLDAAAAVGARSAPAPAPKSSARVVLSVVVPIVPAPGGGGLPTPSERASRTPSHAPSTSTPSARKTPGGLAAPEPSSTDPVPVGVGVARLLAGAMAAAAALASMRVRRRLSTRT